MTVKAFFEWTAWEMERPKSFGPWHLVFLLVGIPLAITVAFLIRKMSDKKSRIMLLCISIFLMLFELYKQLFYYFVMNGENYPLWIIPFQLCSVPMYLCFMVSIIRNRKFNHWLYEFMFAFNLFGGFISFMEPSGLNHPYVTLTLHAYLWHLMLIFLGFYFYFSKRAGRSWKGFFKGIAVLGIVVAIAQIINIVAQGAGGCNMFYISPYVASPLFFFKEFYLQNGWLACMCLYLFGLILACALIYFAAFLCRCMNIKKRKSALKQKNNSLEKNKEKAGLGESAVDNEELVADNEEVQTADNTN